MCVYCKDIMCSVLDILILGISGTSEDVLDGHKDNQIVEPREISELDLRTCWSLDVSNK